MKLTYAQIRHPGLNPLLMKMVRATLPFEFTDRILKVVGGIQDAQQKSEIPWKKIAEKHLESSNLSDANAPYTIKKTYTASEAHRATEDVAKFLKTSVELSVSPIDSKVFDIVGYTVEESVLLNGLFG